MPLPAGAGDPWIPEDGFPAISAVTIRVYRLGAGGLDEIPSLECVDVAHTVGAVPSTARFAFKFGIDRDEAPQTIEQALSTLSGFPDVVRPGDRLIVIASLADGTYDFLFDGYPYGFEAIVSEDGEEVVLACAGVEKRLWDTPIPGMLLRNGDTPETANLGAAPNHVPTDIKAVFNAGGKPNCTPGPDYAPGGGGSGDYDYPVFLDPDVVDPDPIHTYWTLPKACAYLIYGGYFGQNLIELPTRIDLEEALVGRLPIPGAEDEYDPADPFTYDREDILCPELPITGRFVPPVIDGLIADRGMAQRFYLDSMGRTHWDVYLEATERTRDLWLQAHGSSFLDLQHTNVGECHLVRDIGDAPNRWEVHGALDRHMACFVLALGAPTAAADAAAVATFDLAALNTDTRNKYRLYIFDETGEGHYLPSAPGAEFFDVPDLDPILGPPIEGVPRYAKRRRPALGDILPRTDDDRQPWRHSLWISYDYAGESPGLWDGTGTWTEIEGGYRLLHDRLGIWVEVKNPEEWKISSNGKPIKGVSGQAKNDGQSPMFFLMLECVIEADECLKAVADRRDAAVLPERITRVVDARDRYRRDQQHAPVKHGSVATLRDDREAAYAEAVTLREATDAGVLDGPATIPWFTTYYRIGDRIRGINGRNLGFRLDDSGEGAAPILPSIRSIHWQLRGDQTTTIATSAGTRGRKSYKARGRGRRFAVPPPEPEPYQSRFVEELMRDVNPLARMGLA